MKKILCSLLTVLLFYNSTIFASNAEISHLYAPNGNKIKVYTSEVEDYKKLGWFENKEAVIRSLYAPDGKKIKVYASEVEAYKKLGWFENKEDVIKSLYAPDGKKIKVYVSEVEAYKKLGWFENKEDVIVTLVSKDKKRINVYKSEVEAYVKLGWFPTQAYTIDPEKPMVALTFDDGPNPSTTSRILDCLEYYNARATFFVQGYLAKTYPDVLCRMKNIDCQIGNHTYNHPELNKLNAQNIAIQLNTTSKIIKDITDVSPTLMRPPYGAYNKTVSSTAGMPLILWSIDTLDWKSRNANSVINSVLPYVQDGDIILMHDIYNSTAIAAENIIPALIQKGFQLVTVDELAQYKNKPLSAGIAYTKIK